MYAIKEQEFTAALIKFILKINYEDIPEIVLERAKLMVLDNIGVQLAGSSFKIGKIIKEYLEYLGGNKQATVIGLQRKAPCAIAAWANGVLAHALDIDDGDRRGVHSHPSCKSLPAALAVGEYIGVSGKDLLTAFILSTEIQIKVGMLVQPSHFKRGFHGTGTFGVFGAATAAGKLLKLEEKELLYAFGIAGSVTNALCINIATMTKAYHAGNAAEQGVKAALLAKNGWQSSTKIIEGQCGFAQAMSDEFYSNLGNSDILEKMRKIILQLGNQWEIEEPGIYFKAYPSCGYMQHYIDLAIKISKKYNIEIDQIDSVEIGADAISIDLHNLAGDKIPDDGFHARYNIAAGVAVGLSKRSCDIDLFEDIIFRDQKLRELINKIKTYPDSDRIVKVKLKNGKVYTEIVRMEKYKNISGPTLELTKEEVYEKFKKSARKKLSQGKVEKLFELINNLEAVTDVKEITSFL